MESILTTDIEYTTKVPRADLVVALRARDGDKCQFVDTNRDSEQVACGRKLDFTIEPGTKNPREPTIDHWMPQYWCKEQGWTRDQIWDLDNLKLMCKKCNASKGDRIPNADGTLPRKAISTFRYRRQKRANRPDAPCYFCDNGHNLEVGEVCAQCGVNAQNFPRAAKVRYDECDHAAFWCWVCSIDHDMRVGATAMLLTGGEGGD